MATKKEIMDALNRWIELLEGSSDLADQFSGYEKTFLISFSDIDYSVQMVFEGTNKAHLLEGPVPNPEMSLTVESDLFLGICNGEVDPMEAFMEGELDLKGNMADLQKLEVFMDLFDDLDE